MMNTNIKTVIILFLLTLGTAGLLAQNAGFGIKGGINLANMSIDDANDKNIRPGFYFGVMANLPLTMQFAVQPELLYSTRGVEMNYDEDFLGIDIADGETDFKLTYLDIPLYLVFNLSEDFHFYFGPYVGFLLDAKVDTKAEVLEFIEINDSNDLDRDHFKSTEIGLSAGLGFEFGSFITGFNYSHGLTQVAKDDDPSEALLGDAKNNMIQVFVGFLF
ncbi:MAG: porin family protein [Bacteroidales bacterium]